MKKVADERDRKRSMTICLDSDTREKLERMARNDHRSISSFISILIENVEENADI